MCVAGETVSSAIGEDEDEDEDEGDSRSDLLICCVSERTLAWNSESWLACLLKWVRRTTEERERKNPMQRSEGGEGGKGKMRRRSEKRERERVHNE